VLRASTALAAFLLAVNVTLAAAIGRRGTGVRAAGGTGGTIALEQLRGRVVYVDFWASWLCAVPALVSVDE
jgi:hypothetical protein